MTDEKQVVKKEVIILGASRYSFKDDANKQIEGTKVTYIDPDDTIEEDYTGHKCSTANLPYDRFNEFKNLPAVSTMSMEVNFSTKKPSLKVIGFKMVKPLKFS